MSSVFSTNNPTPISCDQPILTVGFPTMGPAMNTVVLANGAIVDLNHLGALIAQFCPAFVCRPNVVQTTAAPAGVQTVQAAVSITPTSVSQVQQTIDPQQMMQMMNQMG